MEEKLTAQETMETVLKVQKEGLFKGQNCLSQQSCFHREGSACTCGKQTGYTIWLFTWKAPEYYSLKTQFNKHYYMSITMHELKTDQVRLQQ